MRRWRSAGWMYDEGRSRRSLTAFDWASTLTVRPPTVASARGGAVAFWVVTNARWLSCRRWACAFPLAEPVAPGLEPPLALVPLPVEPLPVEPLPVEPLPNRPEFAVEGLELAPVAAGDVPGVPLPLGEAVEPEEDPAEGFVEPPPNWPPPDPFEPDDEAGGFEPPLDGREEPPLDGREEPPDEGRDEPPADGRAPPPERAPPDEPPRLCAWAPWGQQASPNTRIQMLQRPDDIEKTFCRDG
jgi:hypothetical protein